MNPTSGQRPATATATDRAAAYIAAVGGAANLVSTAACTTRLRLVIHDRTKVDGAALKALGALGVHYPSPTDLQVILGPIADGVADDIRSLLTAGQLAQAVPTHGLVKALGGAGNVRSVAVRGARICVTVADEDGVDRRALDEAGLRGVSFLGTGVIHLIVGAGADDLAAALGHPS